MISSVTRVRVAPALRRYVVALTTATRTEREIYLGASPRAGIALVRAAKALALLARPRLRGAQGHQGPRGACARPSPGALSRREGARAAPPRTWWRRSWTECPSPKAGVSMPRPTARGLALLGLAAGTYLAGRVVGTWELYLFAFAFAAAVFVSWLLLIASGRRIRVTRVLTPDRPVAGDEPELRTLVSQHLLAAGTRTDPAHPPRLPGPRGLRKPRSRAWLPASRRC